MKKQIEKILLKLKEAFKEESEDNFEMLSTYFLWIEGKATDEDLDRANEQLKEIFKNLGLGIFLILPFSPVTIPFIFKLAKDRNINLIPKWYKTFSKEDDRVEQSFVKKTIGIKYAKFFGEDS